MTEPTTPDEIRKILNNPALSPAYRQVLKTRLKELSVSELSGQPVQTPKPGQPEKRQRYAGVSNMTTEEIVQYYSTGQFYRLDQPISGLEALQSLFRRFGILGKERETVARVAEAIERMGGEVPEMERIDIRDLLRRE
jgi:hypothetical protein